LRSSANRSIEHTSLTASHYCPGLFLRARRAISSRSIKHELRFPVDQQLLLIHGVHIVQHGSCAAAVALSPGAQACLNEAQRQAMLVGSPAVQPAHILLACLHLGKTSGIVAPGADPSTEVRMCCEYVVLLGSSDPDQRMWSSLAIVSPTTCLGSHTSLIDLPLPMPLCCSCTHALKWAACCKVQASAQMKQLVCLRRGWQRCPG
jgi:hypothetical protein